MQVQPLCQHANGAGRKRGVKRNTNKRKINGRAKRKERKRGKKKEEDKGERQEV